jgi:hypothetical protein
MTATFILIANTSTSLTFIYRLLAKGTTNLRPGNSCFAMISLSSPEAFSDFDGMSPPIPLQR